MNSDGAADDKIGKGLDTNKQIHTNKAKIEEKVWELETRNTEA